VLAVRSRGSRDPRTAPHRSTRADRWPRLRAGPLEHRDCAQVLPIENDFWRFYLLRL